MPFSDLQQPLSWDGSDPLSVATLLCASDEVAMRVARAFRVSEHDALRHAATDALLGACAEGRVFAVDVLLCSAPAGFAPLTFGGRSLQLPSAEHARAWLRVLDDPRFDLQQRARLFHNLASTTRVLHSEVVFEPHAMTVLRALCAETNAQKSLLSYFSSAPQELSFTPSGKATIAALRALVDEQRKDILCATVPNRLHATKQSVAQWLLRISLSRVVPLEALTDARASAVLKCALGLGEIVSVLRTELNRFEFMLNSAWHEHQTKYLGGFVRFCLTVLSVPPRVLARVVARDFLAKCSAWRRGRPKWSQRHFLLSRFLRTLNHALNNLPDPRFADAMWTECFLTLVRKGAAWALSFFLYNDAIALHLSRACALREVLNARSLRCNSFNCATRVALRRFFLRAQRSAARAALLRSMLGDALEGTEFQLLNSCVLMEPL